MSEKSKAMEEHIVVPGEKQSLTVPNDIGAVKLHNTQPVYILQFHDTDNNNKEMGKLFNKDGKLCFEGNAEGSAKILFDHVIVHHDHHIKKLDTIIAEKNKEIELLKAENNQKVWC